LLLKRDLAT